MRWLAGLAASDMKGRVMLTKQRKVPKYEGLTTKQRVNRGWKWLDENFPGWQAKINLADLSLADGTKCICGQVFEDDAKRANQRTNADDDKAWGDIYVTPYDYAERTLFAQANSWITSLVGVPTIDFANIEAYTEQWYEARDRAQKVGKALGFVADDNYYITYDDLQREWISRLKAWKAKQEGAKG